MISMATIEEMEEELRKLSERESEIKGEILTIKDKRILGHKSCCDDVCSALNNLISTRKKTISRMREAAESKPMSTVKRLLVKEANIAESQTKDLEEFRDRLYEKSICDCK